jgi:hypothetical protein
MTTCAKCGTENVAGDAFCGSCGAFLEFAAEEAAGDTQAGIPATPPEDAAAAPPSSPPPPVAAPVSAAAAPTVPVPPAPSGPTCSACGRVNPAGRRFCISCGEHLPAATSGVPGSGAGTPAPGAPSKPAWEFPSAPVPAAAAAVAPVTSPTRPADATTSSGGGSRLPLIGAAIVVLALLAGGAVLVLGGGLGGGTPGTTASASPSSGLASASPGTGPSGEPTAAPETPAPGESPTVPPEPTAAPPTIPPGPSVGVAVKGAKASSQLASNRAPKYAYDGSPVTAWLSKAGALDGSWVEVSFAATAVTKIQLWTGWQKDEPTFYGNHRPRNVTVAFDGGVPVPLELKDALGAQGVVIPPELGVVGATRLRITIIDTYPSRKTSAGGSPSKSVAISEIRIFGVPAAP